MFNSISYKVTQNTLLKKTMIGILAFYSMVTTVALVKLSPKTMLIAIEDGGTRVVTTENDNTLKKERVTFLKRVISKMYMYDSTSYKSQISEAGDYMTKELWNAHEGEYTALSEKLKSDEINQKVRIIDLREIDSENYQADIEVTVNHRLQEKKDRITVDYKVRKSKRDFANPYNMEVVDYVEHISQ